MIRSGKRIKNAQLRQSWLLLMTLPGVLLLFLFSYLPMFGVIIAFKDYKFSAGIIGSAWVGLDNFKFLFASQDAWRITRNTLLLNALFIGSGLAVAVGLALLMNEVKNRLWNGIYQSAFFFPYLLSWVLVGYFVYAFLGSDGFLNSLLSAAGVGPVSWYFEPAYWPAILTLIATWKSAGYYSLVYLASILGIDSAYYEAAEIDGASKLQQVFYITLPLLVPIIIIIMTLLQLGRIFYSDFGLFYNVTRDAGMLYATTDVIDTYVFRMLRKVGDFGMASAAGLYQSVVGFLLVFLSNLVVRKINKENALF